MTNRWIWWLALCVGCGGGSGAGNAAPTNTVLEPAIDVTVIVGDSITVRYRDDDPDDEAQTTVLVDRDGDLATTDDQIELAARIDGDGADQEVVWNTTGVVRGIYRVFVRTVDALNDPVVASSTGRIEVTRVPPASIVFPSANARTDAAAITVTGQSLPGADVAAVRVNGVAAASDDGFRTWRAELTLIPGDNTLSLAVESAAGAVDTDFEPISVVRGLSFVGPSDLARDGDRLWILDSQSAMVLELDLATLAISKLAGPDAGSGPILSSPVALATDGARVLVLDNRELISIDVADGTRTRVSGEIAGGEGPAFGVPRALAFRAPPNVFVLDAALFAMFSVDLGTGARAILSDPDTGVGEFVTLPRGASVAASEETVFALSATPATVFEIDVASGDRSILSSDLVGFGPRLGLGADLVADFANARLLVLNSADGSVLEVALDDGDRAELTNGLDPGPSLTTAAALVLDDGRGRVLVADPVRDAIVAVDLITGVRTVLRATDAGSGPAMAGGRVVAVDATGARTFAAGFAATGIVSIAHATGARDALGAAIGVQAVAYDPTRDEIVGGTSAGSIVAVNAATGTTRTVSGPSAGSGPALGSVTAIAIDPAGDRVFVFDEVLDAVVAISLVNGARVIVSDDATGSGPVLRGVFGLALGDGRLLAADDTSDSLLAIDLATGDRTVVSDAASPGAPWSTLRGLALDPDGTRAFVADPAQAAIVAVDLATGTRSILSGFAQGRGTRLSGPEGLAFDGARGLIAAFDVRLGGLVLIDPLSGDRVVASR